MACPDLCTAAKCEELERRIGALEQALELLEAAFETHTSQNIPIAHDYSPDVNVDVSERNNNQFEISVTVDDSQDQDSFTIDIPEPEPYEPQVSVGVYELGNNQYGISVTVDDSQDQDSFTIDIPELEPYEPQVSVDVSERNNNQFEISVTVDDSQDQDSFTIDIPEPEPYEPQVSVGVYELGNNQYGISVTVDDSQDQDSFTIDIPEPEPYEPQVSVGVYELGNNQYGISVTVDDSQDQDSFTIDIPELEMNCDDLSLDFDNFKNELVLKLDNLNFNFEPQFSFDYDDIQYNFQSDIDNTLIAVQREITSTQINLSNKIEVALNTLTQDLVNIETTIETTIEAIEEIIDVNIAGEIESNYKCSFASDESGEIIQTYAEHESETVSVSGKGLLGIQQYLEVIAANLKAIHIDTCKAVDPIFKITVDDLYHFCNIDAVDRADYADSAEGEERYQKAVNDYLQSLLADSKYGYLLEQESSTLVEAPSNWITPIIADFSLIQSRINQNSFCDLELEDPDVVSIVASDKVLGKANGKFLVLHMVTLNNYPKRSRNSTYWQIQIPKAKDEYNWNDDFKPLTWHRGNLYAELYFQSIRDPASGYFLNKESADAWFDSILNLTDAIELNRKYHERKFKQPRDITEQITRPYRAFITSINNQGRAVCHLKYVPPIEENE